MPLDDALHIPVIIVIPDKKFQLVRIGDMKSGVEVTKSYIFSFFNCYNCFFIPVSAFLQNIKILIFVPPFSYKLNNALIVFFSRFFADAGSFALVYMIPETCVFDLIQTR